MNYLINIIMSLSPLDFFYKLKKNNIDFFFWSTGFFIKRI